jgi:large subunit ribosomal protein L4
VAVLKKYDLAGREIGEVSVADDLIKTTANRQMIKDYLVALRANARQWSASTKGRSEVNHTGKKPHPQKGTGRARQGCLAAPQYKGGGRVFAPRPKFDQHVRINKKERRAAVGHLLAEKVKGSRVHILKYEPLSVPKTKAVAQFLRSLKLEGKRVLFLAEGAPKMEQYQTWIRSMRNVPKIEFLLVPNVNGYDLTLCNDVVLMEPAFDELMVLLGGKS